MAHYKTGIYRNVEGYIRQRLNRRNVQALSASGNFDEELWTILEYYSEVETVGLTFLRQAGITNSLVRKKVYKSFRGHIRQAKNFYYSAKSLPPKSAGLLFYYSFLNLTKAALLLKDQTLAGVFIRHGLSYKISDNSPLSKQVVSIENGVFKKLYEWYFGIPVTIESLNIENLLSYCTDIGYQSIMAGIRKDKIIPAYYASAVDKSAKTNWSLVGFYNLNEILKYSKSTETFFRDFEFIALPEPTRRGIFDINMSQDVSFFQSINVKNWLSPDIPDFLGARDDLLNALDRVFQTNYFKEDFDFKVSLPYRINNQVRMDELIAIYTIMFYISNLVRYKPAYLDALFDKKEAWLLESFIRSCPTTFLRMMTSRIVGTDYILESR